MTPEPDTLGLVPAEFQSGFDGESRIRHAAPVVNLVAAGGPFLDNPYTEPIGWAFLPNRIRTEFDQYVYIRVKGNSMQPRVRSGNYCLVCRFVAGSRDQRIVLVEDRKTAVSAYTLKRYIRPPQGDDGDRKGTIFLRSYNRGEHPDIPINENGESQDGRYGVVAEFVKEFESLEWTKPLRPESDDETTQFPPID
jgi:phage repressor protein C with HTH and peptisase S24 domain